MARGANIPISADATGVIREARKVEGALEDVIDSLDNVGDASQDAAKQSERALDSIGDEADKQGERLERSFREAFDAVRTDSRQAGDTISRNVSDGADGASEGMADMAGEAQSTATEVAASFDGSAESIAGGFQELAANAFAGFGPAGAIAGLAAAAGIGLAMGALQAAADEANALTEEAIELRDVLTDPDIEARAEGLAERWKELGDKITDVRSVWELWQSRARTLTDDLADAAKTGKVDVTALMEAFSDPDPQKRLTGLKKAQEQLNDVIEEEARKRNIGAQSADEHYFDYLDQSKRVRDAIADEIAAQQVAIELEEARAAARHQTVLEMHNEEAAERRVAEAREEGAAAYVEAREAVIEAEENYRSAIEDVVTSSGTYAEVQDTVRRAAEEAATAAGKSAEEVAKAGQDATVSMEDYLAGLAQKVAEEKQFEANMKALAERGFGAYAEEIVASEGENAQAIIAMLAGASDTEVQTAATAAGTLNGKTLVQGTATEVQSAQSRAKLQQSVNGLVSNITSPSIPITLTADPTPFLTSLQKTLNNAAGKHVTIPFDGKYVGGPWEG